MRRAGKSISYLEPEGQVAKSQFVQKVSVRSRSLSLSPTSEIPQDDIEYYDLQAGNALCPVKLQCCVEIVLRILLQWFHEVRVNMPVGLESQVVGLDDGR